jgi:4-alpha-glucanotransferase
MLLTSYENLLNSLAGASWKRIGIKRRSGVVAPLFSVYSSKSVGIGEFPDIFLLADWCAQTGMSLIQLLPMNDVGFGFRPYDAQSSFALEPMYLSIERLRHVDIKPFQRDLTKLKNQFPTSVGRINCKIKGAKLALFWKIFASVKPEAIDAFCAFKKEQCFWLEDYALFKIIKEGQNECSWERWPPELKNRKPVVLAEIKKSHQKQILFQEWLQWQCYEQFKDAKEYAASRGVIVMGDLPFLVSRDSADAWSKQEYFKMEFSSGAPPDMLYAHGQRWGMPPYNWGAIAAHDYDYIKEKLRFAENFYDLYRIDHVVGIFRVWSIPNNEPPESGGLNGSFDPPDERTWEEHGRRLLTVMLQNTRMLACAEDLGTVPPVTPKTLAEFGIPGIDIQRWMRDWGKTYNFTRSQDYRAIALATLGTHDMSCFNAWWDFEAGTVDDVLFSRKCAEKGLDIDAVKARLFDLKNAQHGRLRWRPEISSTSVFLKNLGIEEGQARDLLDMFLASWDEKDKFLQLLELDPPAPGQATQGLLKAALEKITLSSCIFTTQLLQDWLSLDGLFDMDPWEMRVNFPGTVHEKNWTLAMPMPLEDIMNLPVNTVIKKINEEGGR